MRDHREVTPQKQTIWHIKANTQLEIVPCFVHIHQHLPVLSWVMERVGIFHAGHVFKKTFDINANTTSGFFCNSFKMLFTQFHPWGSWGCSNLFHNPGWHTFNNTYIFLKYEYVYTVFVSYSPNMLVWLFTYSGRKCISIFDGLCDIINIFSFSLSLEVKNKTKTFFITKFLKLRKRQHNIYCPCSWRWRSCHRYTWISRSCH